MFLAMGCVTRNHYTQSSIFFNSLYCIDEFWFCQNKFSKYDKSINRIMYSQVHDRMLTLVCLV